MPPAWKTAMREVAAGVFAYVQATGQTGISNAGLVVGSEGAVAVDALMVPSMTRRLMAAIKRTTRKRIGTLINTHHHLDHTGGNRFFPRATNASWHEAERILPNVMRCYQEFRDETHLPLDIPAMLEGMERVRGRRADHTCL